MFCNQCGTRNDEGNRFCTNCGAPIIAPEDNGTTQVAAAAPAPTHTPPAAPTSPVPHAAPTAAVPAPSPARRRRMPWLIAIIAAVTAVALCAAFLTYRAEIWGGRSLPDVAQVVAEVSDGTNVDEHTRVRAKQVIQVLRAHGLTGKLVHEFSGQPSGTFLGYAGALAGQRVPAGSTVNVRVSDGPGVPKGTVGKQVGDVADSLASMGVRVQYKQVAVSNPSKYQDGEIVTTSPADGRPLPDGQTSDGIYIGVAGDVDGMPIDILGMESDQAIDLLESQGYTVTLTPRFSSRDYLGKISGSVPGPGSALTPGQSVTLYYGADADDTMTVLTTYDFDTGYRMANGDLSVLAGQYCKSDDDVEDCVTLEPTGKYFNAQDQTAVRIAGHDDPLLPYTYSQDIGGMLVEPPSGDVAYTDKDDLPMGNHLLLQDWGMFELYAGMGLPSCGADTFIGDIGSYCDNGTLRTYDPSTVDDLPQSTGVTYTMRDFLVYFPVNSDLDALKSSGYFDTDALDDADVQDPVDPDRPFILVRDPSLYDETSIPVDLRQANPFAPSNRQGKNSLVPMKPAISNDTVYYLVEQAEPDWSTLPDADVPASDDADDADGKNGSDTDDGDAADAASLRIFKGIAGDYGFSSGAGGWGTTMTVNADGTFDGYYSDSELGDTGAGYPNGSLHESRFSGRFASAIENGDGTYTLQCAADELSVEGEIGSERIEDGTRIVTADPYGVSPCGTFTVYPPGYDASRLSDEVTGWAAAWMVDGLPATLESPIIVNDNEQESFYTLP